MAMAFACVFKKKKWNYTANIVNTTKLPYICGPISAFSILSHGYICLSICRNQTTLTTVALGEALKIDSVNPPI